MLDPTDRSLQGTSVHRILLLLLLRHGTQRTANALGLKATGERTKKYKKEDVRADKLTLSSTAVERAIAQRTSRRAMARGHRLNTSIVLAAVHGLSGLFRAGSAVEPSLSRPLPTLSPSLMGHLASVDVKQHGSKADKS